MRALDRVTSVLEAVAASPDGLTVTEVAERAGLTLPTASRLARDLAAAGMLSRVSGNGAFKLGPKLIAMAYSPGAYSSLLDSVTPLLHNLRDTTEETASVHVPVGDQRVCLRDVPSPHQVRRVIPPGSTFPLHKGATGVALFAFLPEQDRTRYLTRLEPEEGKELQARVVSVRQAGWAMADGEVIGGVAAIAAPILINGRAIAVLSVSGPSSRWTPDRMATYVDPLVEGAAMVSKSLGLDSA